MVIYLAKVNIHSILKNESDNEEYVTNVKGILTENQLHFLEEETKVEITLNEEIQIKRINKNDILQFFLHPTLTREGIYDIKSVSIELHLKTKTKLFKINENGFEVHYQMELEGEEPKQYQYKLEYEVII